MAPQRWKVPISIVAVNHIEAIDHIDWLHNELNIYGGGFEPLSPHADFFFFFFYVILFFYSWISFTNVQDEPVIIFIPTNVQFENVSFFIKASDEEKFLLF